MTPPTFTDLWRRWRSVRQVNKSDHKLCQMCGDPCFTHGAPYRMGPYDMWRYTYTCSDGDCGYTWHEEVGALNTARL